MIALRKISEETLAKASVLTHQQMGKVVGGGNQECGLRCDQNVTGFYIPVSSCDAGVVGSLCGGDLSRAVCSCSGGGSGESGGGGNTGGSGAGPGNDGN